MDTPEFHALLFSVHSMATSQVGFFVPISPDATTRFQSLTNGGRKRKAFSTEGGCTDCR